MRIKFGTVGLVVEIIMSLLLMPVVDVSTQVKNKNKATISNDDSLLVEQFRKTNNRGEHS